MSGSGLPFDPNQAFPNISQEFVDERQFIHRVWHQFLVSLWNRTGAGTGDPNLIAIELLTGTGLLVRTGDPTWALRDLEADSGSGIKITNPAGTAGNPSFGWDDETAHFVLIGPASGSAATPTWRLIVPDDLPVATNAALGISRPDDTSITIAAGVLTVPTATNAVLGLSRPDNTTIKVAAGVLTATLQGGSAYTVAALPTGIPAYSRAFVTDSDTDIITGLGTTPVHTTGANQVPVYTIDGTNWLIG